MEWTQAVVVVTALAVATGAGLLLRRTNGRFRTADNGDAGTGATVDPVLASLGVTTGTPVTLVQFSSAFCASCRATRVLCADVAQRVPGVRHIEVDAESNLDAVRALDVWRTPTVLVVDSAGSVRRRASGAPTRAQLVAAIGDVLGQPDLSADRS